jgi:hypothetical protein
MAALRRRLPLVVALWALLAVLGALGAGDAAAQSPIQDRWSGRWETSFTTIGGGQERTTGTLCCIEVTLLSDEQGRALANGTTGVVGEGTFTDVVCASGPHLYYDARSPFEFVSGVTGVVPGPDRPTQGSRVVFCTDGTPDGIRGHYQNDLAAFDPLIGNPITQGSALARRTGPQAFEGSVGTFTSPNAPGYITNWEGHCLSGACRQERSRPRLIVRRISAYNVLLSFLRGQSPRAARLELTRSDGTSRAIGLGASLDLEDGDVITSHGMYATLDLTRADASVVTLSLEPGGSIGAGADPMLIRHRGGTVVAGSLAGFTSDSAIWDRGSGEQAVTPNATVKTTVTKGRVRLELDPARRSLTVRNLAGQVRVQSGGSALTVPVGQDALATSSKVRRLPAAPNLASGVVAPRLLTAGPVQLLAPSRLTGRSLSRARCLATRLRSTGSAQALVTLLAGTARRGSVVVQRRVSVGAGSDLKVCLPLSVKARGIPAGTPLTIALGVRAGTRRLLTTGRISLTIA